MKLINKLSTIIGWTFLGGVSAYIIASIITFSQLCGIMLLMEMPLPPWVVNFLLGGLGTGFLLGMAKACVVDTADAARKSWRK